MASLQDSTSLSTAPGGMRLALAERVTVYDLFRRHARLLAGLPGEVSQFEAVGFGYEWRCECSLSGVDPESGKPSPEQELLHFSVVDIEGRLKPAAVLYLVQEREGMPTGERLLLPLVDLDQTQDILIKQLSEKRASIEALERADHFITELGRIREVLGGEVEWTEAPD